MFHCVAGYRVYAIGCDVFARYKYRPPRRRVYSRTDVGAKLEWLPRPLPSLCLSEHSFPSQYNNFHLPKLFKPYGIVASRHFHYVIIKRIRIYNIFLLYVVPQENTNLPGIPPGYTLQSKRSRRQSA